MALGWLWILLLICARGGLRADGVRLRLSWFGVVFVLPGGRGVAAYGGRAGDSFLRIGIAIRGNRDNIHADVVIVRFFSSVRGFARGQALLACLLFHDTQYGVRDIAEGAAGVQVHFAADDGIGDVFQKLVDLGEILQGAGFEIGRQDGLGRTAAGLSAGLAGCGLFVLLLGIVEETVGFAGLGIGLAAAAVFVEMLAAGLVAEDFFNIHPLCPPFGYTRIGWHGLGWNEHYGAIVVS